MSSEPIDFANLITQSDDAILAALKTYEIKNISQEIADYRSRFGREIHRNIGELPEAIQKEILERVKPHLSTIRSLGVVPHDTPPELIEEVTKAVAKYREKTLKAIFKQTGETAFFLFGSKAKGTNAEEMIATMFQFPSSDGKPEPQGYDAIADRIASELDWKKRAFDDHIRKTTDDIITIRRNHAEYADEAEKVRRGNEEFFADLKEKAEAADKERKAAQETAEQAKLSKIEENSEGFLKKFGKMHWGTKTAIIGGTVALGGALGYWAFKSKDEKRTIQQTPAAQL